MERSGGGVEPWVQPNPDGGMGATMTRLRGSGLSLPRADSDDSDPQNKGEKVLVQDKKLKKGGASHESLNSREVDSDELL